MHPKSKENWNVNLTHFRNIHVKINVKITYKNRKSIKLQNEWYFVVKMNVIDRVESAKHALTGSGIGRAVSKATSHEIIGPKRKHVECEFQFIISVYVPLKN